MRNTLLTYIDRFMHDRHSRKVLGSVLLVLAIAVSLTVYWQLRLHGIAITNETYCGYEEHVHTEECYETTLICNMEEIEGHTHDESCYDEEGNLVCELEECEPHTHTDECYETTLICEIPEHTHTSDCLVDLEADVEDATVWEVTLPELMGDLRADIVNIAYSQLGYTESTANYTLAEDGTTKMGYTRYGAWYGGLYYGSEYSDWDSLFVAFCLDYAGIAEDFTYNSGAYAWSVDLTALGYYQTADSYAPSIGDVVFIDTDADGRANITAIVVSIDETAQTITVIQGNYTIADSEGNSTDTVAVVTYSTATETVTQNEIIALSAGSEAEITPVVLGYANVTYVNVTDVAEEEEEVEEITIDEEETAELIEEEIEEITVEEIDGEETEEADEEETVLLTTASAVLTYDEYCSEAYSLYTYAMSVTDSTEAASAWSALMSVWDEIDDAYADGTLTVEEYESLNDIMYAYYDEVYAYYTESVGYDPYGVMTADEDGEEGDDGSEETGTLTSSPSLNLKDYSSVEWTYNSASYSDDKFSISFHIDFSNLAISNINSGTTFYLNLPTGVTVPDSYEYTHFNGYDNSGQKVFTYTFAYDENTETWQIVITFDESYNDIDDGTIDGYVDFSGTYVLQGNDVDEGGNVVIKGTDTGDITIKAEDITTSDNENWLADIKVEKSSSTGYNTSTKSITYTVVVSSENGTDGEEITLDDVIKIVNNSSYSNTGMSVESVEIDRVTYYTDYYSGYYDTNAGTAVTNYTDNSTATKLSLVLPALSGSSVCTATNATGDCYVIVYTVTFKTDSSEYNSSITNTATATSETSAGEITDESEVTKNAIDSSVKKTGVYDSTDNKIYWTITFNSSHSNIANYTISDAMLSQMVDGSLNVSYTTTDSTTSVDAVADTDYSISGGTITFLPVDDTVGDDGVADSNTYAYTITYTTDANASLGSTGYTSRNTVTVNNDENKEQAKEYGDVWVGTGGSLQKALSSTGEADETTKTRVLNWTTTVTVPAGGITSGTVLYDYLGVSSGDKSSFDDDDATSVTKQWFTYTQINTLFSGLTTYGIKIGDYTVNYEVISGEGEDAVYSFTLEAYDATAGKWVEYSEITSGDSTHLYTAYSITFNENVEYSGTWTISYSTTANISDVLNYTLTSEYYNNRVEIGSLSADAGYTEQSLVYKTDGKYNFENSTVTVDDTGILTWIVNVYITPGSTETYTVVDTLPAGLTFDSAKVSINWDTVTLTPDSNGEMSGTFGWIDTTKTPITGEVTGDSTNGTVVTINIDPNHYSCINTSGGYVTITYTAHITDIATKIIDAIVGNNNFGSYENSVKVTLGTDTPYGEDTQKQTTTYTKSEEGGSTSTDDHDTVEKSGSYNGADATLRYSVLLNLDADNIDKSEGGDYLTFTDTASHYYTSDSNANWHTSLLSLQDATVTFYKLTKLELIENTTYSYGYYTYIYDDDSGEVVSKTPTILVTFDSVIGKLPDTDLDSASIYKYTESDGTYTYYYKEKITVNWTYSATTTASVVGGSGNYYYTITATVPDKTAILVEYWYNISASADGNGFEIGNSATLSYDGTTAGSDGDNEQHTWEDPTTTGGVTSGSGITVYKVATGSYSTTLPGATFEMWKYDTTQQKWVQVTQGDFATGYLTDDSGTKTTTGINNTTNSMDENNHLVTGTNGTITITNKFEYEKDSYAYYDWFEEDTLYYIVEVSAPDGYELITQQKIYFYWSGSGTLTYPSDVDTSSVTVYDLNSTSINPTVHIENQPNTTFTLTKVSSTDTGLTLAGATFALYEFHDDSDVTAAEGTWTRIGTYVTDDNGEITITFNSNIYTFNHAYKLVEESSPDDYNIAYNDDAAFYFYWGSSDNTTYPPVLPSDWKSGSTGTSASEALNIATTNGTVQATNTKNTTTIAVKKAWVNEAGEDMSSTGNYTATVQLYYYLADKNGNPIRDTSSTAKYITLSSSTSDTTVAVYSKTLANTLTLGSDWASISSAMNITDLLSAIYNDAYNDAYVEVVVVGGNKPSNMSLILQTGSGDYYISPSSVDSETDNTTAKTTYTVRYSVEDILNAVSSSSDITGLCLTGNSYGGTVQSISVVVPMNVSKTDSAASSAFLSTYTDGQGNEQPYTWNTRFYGSDYASAVSTAGAVLEISYSGATAGTQIAVGISDGSNTTYAQYITLTAESDIIYVSLSDMSNYASFNWDNYQQTYIQAITWNSDTSTNTSEGTTITGVRLLVPSESSTSTTYEIAATGTSPTNSEGTETLTNKWTTYLTGDANAKSALTTDGSLIYITYTCGDSVPSSVTVGVQYNGNAGDSSWGSAGSTTVYSVSSGTGTITVPVSSILDSSYSSDNYNAIYLQVGSDSYNLTVTSVQVLTPYSADTSISPDLSSNVVLYNPSTSSYNTSLTSGYYIYNALSSREDEDKTAEYDDSNITDRDSVVFTGYGFLDAVYSDVADSVVITLSDVSLTSNYNTYNGSSTDLSDYLKSSLLLKIQGDLSANYGEILSVTPTSVTNSNGTYTVTYSASEITQILKNYGYSSAEEAYADYNSLVLAYSHNEAFSATVTDLQVTGTVTSYYSSGDLVGTYSGGQEYTTTDDSGDTVEYIYTLDSDNDWSVAIANLPLSYTDTDGTVYYYEYYFVETGEITGVEDEYTVYTTYSQDEGENGGGEIVVVNTLVETTEVTVEKKWVDSEGNDVSDDFSAANVTFDLYYYLAYTDSEGNLHYYNDGSSPSSGDDDDDDSGDSGDSEDSGGTTTGEEVEVTSGTTVYLNNKNTAYYSVSEIESKEGVYATLTIPEDAEEVTVDLVMDKSDDTTAWFGIDCYTYSETSVQNEWIDGTGTGVVDHGNDEYSFTFTPSSSYNLYTLRSSTIKSVTFSYTVDNVTYTKTFTSTSIDTSSSTYVNTNGTWSPDGNYWTVTTTSTDPEEQNTASAASLGEEVNGIALLASAGDTATLYFSSGSYLTSEYATALTGIPYDTDVTVKITNDSTSYTWYSIYGYTDASSGYDSSWSGYEYGGWGSGTTTWTFGSTELSGTITTDSSHPYYLVSYTSASSSADETITVSYDDVTYTNTYSASEGTWSGWEKSSTGTGSGDSGDTGSGDSGGSGATSIDDATSYYVGEYTITYGDGDWSTVISDLPVYEIIGTTQYTRYYYVVETGTSVTVSDGTLLQDTATYENNNGIKSGTITITNTVDETAIAYVMPSTISFDYTRMYDFGIMLILLSLVGAGAYTKSCRNISRIRKSLVEEPHRDGVDPGGTHERLPNVRNRKFVIHRHPRKGDTRAGPDG